MCDATKEKTLPSLYIIKKTHGPDIMGALTPMVFKERFLTIPFVVDAPAPILLKRDYPVL